MKSGLLSTYVAYEIGFNKWINCESFGINFECEYRYKGDHKGFFFRLYIANIGFEFNIYDTRHEDE